MFFRASLAVLAFSLPALGQAADTKLVRDTEALAPAEERAKLHVPAGFELQLFASEPMINKPINMAFDARGRLWVSSTVEYPYAAKRERWADDQGTRVKDSRDAIKILSDTDGDGQADQVTDFADGLNIPTGVLPWHKPEHKAGCIAWSIPNIWYFADTDGDDKADVREVIFGPLGFEKDTHGMCSSFRLGLDGWVYATHGFNNTSHIKARDGSTLELHSGNVFRFKPDGSRVEPWTHGQVNPFGLCWDKYGNLYSADCHSSPIYQLIRGAYYPSFGKPHDGLGFAPVMCQHSHGSTGICGIVYIDGGVWGPEWDDHTLVGNVVTSTVNQDKVTFTGATPKANEKPDFLTSDDPWFRPVDLQLGPDNALYIADFYNKIIGHYEVPLEHPGRDKERGRIWRVVKKDRAMSLTQCNLETLSDKELAQQLGEENLRRRYLSGEVICRRGDAAYEAVSSVVAGGDLGASTPEGMALRMAHWLWAAVQLKKLGLTQFQVASLFDDLSSAHAARVFRIIYDHQPVPPRDAASIRARQDYTSSASPGTLPASTAEPEHEAERADEAAKRQHYVSGRRLDARAAAESHKAHIECQGASGSFGAIQQLQALLAGKAAKKDPTLYHTIKIALRQLLSLPGSFDVVPPGLTHLDEVALAVPNAEASAWLWKAEMQAPQPSMPRPQVVAHIARNGRMDLLPAVIVKVRAASQKAPVAIRLELIQALHDGLSERGAPANAGLLVWAQELAGQLLTLAEKQPSPAWSSVATEDSAPKWALRLRKCADGQEAQVLQSVVQGGAEEKLTGILRSQAFPTPAKLTLWINGHRGFPTAPAHDKNLVRVVDAKTGETLATVFPPRNDVCQPAEIDLSKHAGKQARLEIVDGDDGKAYAWLGITRIEPAVVTVDDFQGDDAPRAALRALAVLLQHTAPAALREKLAAYLPPRPAPPPLPVSAEQRKQLDALIAARVESFAKAKPDIAAGKAVFKTHCATCHQINGEGGLIGPQLDGIGARGPARLCEDVLDPNRNVDAHFHLHVLTLKDGSSVSGFLKAEAGQMLVLADATGREHRVSKKDATQTEITPVSLMPPVFGQLLDEMTFLNLLGYLVNEKAKP